MEQNNNAIEQYDTEHFHFKFFRQVPPNYELVTENYFSAEVNVLKSGFHIVAPWKKSIYVSLKAKTKDYPKKTFEAQNKIDVEIDYAVEIKVVDSEKYTYSTNKIDKRDSSDRTTPETMLETVIDDILRTIASRMDYDELVNFQMDFNDTNDPQIQEVKNQFNLFALKYGLSVESFNIKSINQTAEASKKYQEQKFREIDRQNKVKDEEAQLKISEMRANAIASMMKQLVDSGMTKEQAYDMVRTNIINENPNTQWVNISGGSGIADLGAQFQMGANAVSGSGFQKKK